VQPEIQEKKLRTRDRLIFGILLPVLVLIAGMLVIASVDSRAGAAEFAGLGVFLGLVISLPVVLLFNLLFLLLEVETRKSCFLCGMILPMIVFIAAIVYQSGLWDKLT
jgi:hypothetical protein